MEEKQEKLTPVAFSYYSNVLKKPFTTLKELQEAEDAFNKENEEKLKLVEVKKTRAKEIEDAYKHSMEVRKEAQAKIREADEAYYKLRDAFVKDYGSYHLSVYNDGKHPEEVTFSDLIDSFFNNWLF